MAVGAVLATAPSAAAEPDAAPAPDNLVRSSPPHRSQRRRNHWPRWTRPCSLPRTVPSSIACKQFPDGAGYAATNYEDFVYATAGGGNYVDYDNPEVQNSNVVGRTALREAASTARGRLDHTRTVR